VTFHSFGRSDLIIRSPYLDAWIVRRLLAGAHPRAIAAATAGAISERTAYRWKRDVRGIEEVRVGDHVATFVLRRDQPPTRVTPWLHKPVSARVSKRLGGIRCEAWMPHNQEPCARFAGHRGQHNSAARMVNAAEAERRKRDQLRRQRQRVAA
jgi:hypothetical protein